MSAPPAPASVPPATEPRAIRAGLTPTLAAEFDHEWLDQQQEVHLLGLTVFTTKNLTNLIPQKQREVHR